MALVKTVLGGQDFNGTFSKIQGENITFTACTAVSGAAVNTVKPLTDFVDPVTATTLVLPVHYIVSVV